MATEPNKGVIDIAKTCGFTDAIGQISDLLIAHRPAIVSGNGHADRLLAWFDMVHKIIDLKGRHET